MNAHDALKIEENKKQVVSFDRGSTFVANSQLCDDIRLIGIRLNYFLLVFQ